MTRRCRLRPRTLVLVSLAALIAVAVALPALGALSGPDALQQELRSWDIVIGDGRTGQSLPQQVIVVLAAPPAVDVKSPDAASIAGSAQQLDLDAIARAGIWMNVQYRYVNALNAVSATVRPDQLAQLRASPEVAGIYPVRRIYPATIVSEHLASLGAAARPIATTGRADGSGVRVALLDGPVDTGHPYLHQPQPAWDAITGQPQDPNPDPTAAAHGTAMAGIVIGRDGPDGLHGVAPGATLLPIQIMEVQHGALMGTTATLLAGIDRALDPNGDGNLSDHADVILAPVAEPFAAFGASAESVAAEGAERAGAVLVAAAGNDGPTGARFGTIASPAASPEWIAVGATDGRSALPTTSVSLTSGGSGGSTVDDAPVVGALTPPSGTSFSLELPSGPTKSEPTRAPADIALGTDPDDFRKVDGASLVRGKAVLLPRDGASIAQRAAAAGAAGAKALVLYGDGGAPAGALGLNDRVKIPIVMIPGEQGAEAVAALLTGGSVSAVFGDTNEGSNPLARTVAPFSSTGLAFDDSVKPDLVAPGVAVTSSAPGGKYMAQTGTSVAAAQVAGAAAIVEQKHPGWSPALVRGALVGSATEVGGGTGDAPAPVEAQGGGAIDVSAAAAATVIAEPSTLSFGLALASHANATRVLTLANTGSATAHVSVSLSRDDAGADGSSVSLADAPSSLAIAPGGTVKVPLTLKATSLPDEAAVIGGWVIVATAGGPTVRVPWALARSDDLAAGLIGDASLDPVLVEPAGDGDIAARLTLVVGSATANATDRLDLMAVQRLSVDLYHGSQLLGRIVERHELLPGSYRYGITGIDPGTGKPLPAGVYRLVIDAVSTDDVTSERQLGFTVG